MTRTLTAVALLLCVLIAGILWMTPRDLPAAAAPAHALTHRTPWTTSKLTGSPDAPPPYRLERVYPTLTFEGPVDAAYRPDNGLLYVAELPGKIFFLPDEKTRKLAFDAKSQIKNLDRIANTRGVDQVLGFTFHPKFAENRYAYVCYVLGPQRGKFHERGSRISRFTVRDDDTFDPDSELFLIDWQGGGHNGCSLHFGPRDGYLYFSAGDAGDPNPPDPFDTGQDLDDLLSCVVRIDVDRPSNGKNYSIPKDNPFVNTPGARGEIYAYGLRNPWRMSFDKATGNLWVGDVGWELWEMVYRVTAGANFGWSITEGPQPVHAGGKQGPTPIVPPVLALPHTESASVTGGFVYHGKRFPELAGHYVFGDWETRRIWAARAAGDSLEPYRTIALTDERIIAFAEDREGELLIVGYEPGSLHRLARNNTPAGASEKFPRKLSDTGLFADVRGQQPADGVVRFSINSPQYLDGAIARHFVAISGTANVTPGGFPPDSVLARTITLPTGQHVETQFLHLDGKQWKAYTYAWDDAQADATLVDAAGARRTFTSGDGKTTWSYASRAQCMTCHTSWSGYTLAYTPAQLARPHQYGDVTDDQLKTLRNVGLLAAPDRKNPDPKPLANPHDAQATLESRARSYLHTNCSTCHRNGGGGSALIDVRAELPLNRTGLIDKPPLLGDFNLSDARLVAPGHPARSVLLYRLAKTGQGRMPRIGPATVDDHGLALLTQWVQSLDKNAKPTPVTTPDTPTNALSLSLAIATNSLTPGQKSAAISAGSASQDPFIRDLFLRFVPSTGDRLDANPDPQSILSLPGEPARGRKLFSDPDTALCQRCHLATDNVPPFGPDLSKIAVKYPDRATLLDHILNPSKHIDPPYVAHVIKTTANEDLSGIIAERTATDLIIKDATLQARRIPLARIKRLTPQSISPMPEGLLIGLTPQDAADILAYLATLK